MVIVTECLLYDLLILLVTLVVTAATIIYSQLNYWKRLGIPYIKAQIPFIHNKSEFENTGNIYTHFKSQSYPHGGIYIGTQPYYIPVDNAIVKKVLQTDFNHFMNHGTYYNTRDDPLSGHLFNLEDEKWKNLRIKLTPTFTSGKMKYMFQTLADCSVGLTKIMNKTADTQTPVDIKDILARFTTDIIGSTAFGIECNSLENPNSEFRKYGKKVFERTMLTKMKIILLRSLPFGLLRFLRVTITLPDVSDFFLNSVKDIVNYRETNNIQRKDFLQLLLQIRNNDGKTGSDQPGLSIEELAAQCFVFFLAGFETSSTTMTFALYEIATNPDIQEKLRNEISEVLEKHNGKMTYEAIMEMSCMDKVVNETLRKYPPLAFLNRVCSKDWPIPDTNAVLGKGTSVGIMIKAIHYDEDYYPNPEVFDPERFSEEAKQARPGYTFLPFGEGPRLCIGLRFGLLQSKVGLTALLKNYVITLNSKTKVPLEMDPFGSITSVKGGVWINVKKIV